ncbi:MAG: heme ABC exporter ATP-binding protein CcmA [Rhodospirillaceae bacterium]|nr:heme ABC exporter ATP-binding protein CcmA [Rhodospirillaceae bacterium]
MDTPDSASGTYPAISLSVEGLACIRGGRAVFGGLSFAGAGGDAIELHGPNGAGKSSLLRLLAGLLHPAAGTIAWTAGDGAARPPLAYCGHRDPVKAWLTVREQLAWWRDLEGGGSVEGAAQAMGLGPLLEVAGGLLSAGQRRRLALARLALTEAPVWLLDEPTVSLDEDGAALLRTMIGRHRSQGGLAIAATHLPIGLPDARTVMLPGDAAEGPDGP